MSSSNSGCQPFERERPGANEEAIIAAFYRRSPTYTDTHRPSARRMAKFKAQLFLDADNDPQWHISR